MNVEVWQHEDPEPPWSEDLRTEMIDVRLYPVEKIEQFNMELRLSARDAIDRLTASYRGRKKEGINLELFALCSTIKYLFHGDPEAIDEYDAALDTVDVWAKLLKQDLLGVYKEMISFDNLLLEFPVRGLQMDRRGHCWSVSHRPRLLPRSYSPPRTTWCHKGYYTRSNLLASKGTPEKYLPGCGEGIRATALTFLEHCFPLFDQSPRNPETRAPMTALLCWGATDENHPLAGKALKYVSAYVRLAGVSTLVTQGREPRSPLGFMVPRIMAVVKNPQAVGWPRDVALRDLGSFLVDRLSQPTYGHWPSSDSIEMVCHIYDALVRQLAHGDTEHHWSIFSSVLVLLRSTKSAFAEPRSTSLSTFTEEGGVIAWILAHALVICVENNCERHELFTDLLSIYRAAAVQRTKNLVFINQRKAVQKEWYPTLKILYDKKRKGLALPPEFETLVEEWRAFGEAFGLDEDKEQDRCFPDLEKRCAWKECQWHAKTHTDTREMLCPECKERRYCDLLCRRRDWHSGGHKDKCPKLKAQEQRRIQTRLPGKKRTVSFVVH
ncbi:hypothetical protein OF83DRAFT_1098667 [Amylostereum chailletii]|nr:hypothetical protein OF83DRAFT_1098667 [Amylostereum chailletii]